MRMLLLATVASIPALAANAQNDGAMLRDATGVETTRPAGLILAELVRNAALVFRGRVANLDYSQAEQRGREGSTLPVTLVTYEIDEVYKGAAPGETITLAFLGGPTGRPGQYLLVEGYPTFDVGEEGFLFLQGDQRSPCPLVDCAEGRFRVVEDRVYTDEGRQLFLGDGGAIRLGGYTALDEVVSNELPMDQDTQVRLQDLGAELLQALPPEVRETLSEGQLDELRRRLEIQPVRPVLRRGGQDVAGDAVAGEETEVLGEPLSAAEFGRLIDNLAAEGDARQRFTSVPSATPGALIIEAPEAGPPSAGLERTGVSDQERQERELYEQNEGNPALPER